MKKKAFTLVEVVVVMAIIAILGALIVAAIIFAQRTAKDTTNRGNAKTLQTALEAQYAKTRAYCGVTGAPTCPAANATIASVATTFGVTNLPAACAGGTYDGGGQVNSMTASSYKITPVNYTCAAGGVLTADIIEVQ